MLFFFIEKYHKTLDCKSCTDSNLMDLFKTFDSINHRPTDSQNIFRNSLTVSDRWQRTKINSPLTKAVPQASVLRPNVFNTETIYFNF